MRQLFIRERLSTRRVNSFKPVTSLGKEQQQQQKEYRICILFVYSYLKISYTGNVLKAVIRISGTNLL